MDALGVDVGGVIIDRINDGTDTSFFTKNYLNTTAVPGAVAVLARLVRERFGDNVFIVSKCGARTEAKTLHWLHHNGFFKQTGISPDHVRFCRTREGKAPICQGLGITHFIDDRLEVLSHLASVPHKYLFQGIQKEVARFEQHLAYVYQVETWTEIEARLL
jgi:hypothetical protein